MEYVRNHLNPALIIKRFKPTREDFNLYFPNSLENYDDKKKPPVIMLEKESFFKNNTNLQVIDHDCTNTKADCFIKERLYFLDEGFLNQLIYSANDEKTKEYIEKKQNISLEKSLGPYETRVSAIFDKHLSTNFNNLTPDEKKVILKFWDSSHLRPLKYKKFQEYLEHKPIDPFADLLISQDFLQNGMDNIKELIKDKEFEEVIILFIIYSDYFEKIVFNEKNLSSYDSIALIEINSLKRSLYQIPLLFHTIKNEEDLKDKNGNDIIVDSNLIYIQSMNCEFILGDNTVFTLYKNYSSNIIDIINDYLINNKIITEPLLKLSIMVVSPKNIIIKSDKKSNLNNFIVNDDFVKLINALTLFNTDEWIVSKTILNDIKYFIDIKSFNKIQHYDFFEKDILNCLNSFNYVTGIPNKFEKFNEDFLDNLCSVISEEIDSNYNITQNKYVMFSHLLNFSDLLYPSNLIVLKPIIDADISLISYLLIKVRIAINTKLKMNLDWTISIGEITEIDLPKYKYNQYLLCDFDRKKDYHLLVIHLEK